MSLLVNLRHLEQNALTLEGELSVEDLDLGGFDRLIQAALPLQYQIEVQLQDKSLLVQGWLKLRLECACVRCLTPFIHVVELPEWACFLPLEGEDQVAVVNDCVDLTPPIREDILLEFPRHPLCKPDCRGLLQASPGKSRQAAAASPIVEASPAWAALDKLKFEKE